MGDLSPERLSLAGYLGDPSARRALACEPGEEERIEQWVRGLREWGAQACVRAAVAAARVVLPVWESWEPGELAPRGHPRRAVDATEAWMRVGTDATRDQSTQALAAAEEVVDGASQVLAAIDQEHRGVVGASAWRAIDAGCAAVAAARAAHWTLWGNDPRRGTPETDVGWAVKDCAVALQSRGATRAAIRDALVPWALLSTESATASDRSWPGRSLAGRPPVGA